MTEKSDTPAELRSFGRRRGRALSRRQQELVDTVLPRLALDLSVPAPRHMEQMFASSVREVWLEIGFGGGEHLLWQAEHDASVGVIGCEPFIDGVVKVLAAVEAKGHGNVRLHADDARDVLRWLPPASISRAFILFPDPWPKRRHQKRRLVAGPLLDLLARCLKPGAQLRIATDIPDYVRSVLVQILPHPGFDWPATGPKDWQERPADWPPTRYEQKALREGRRPVYLTFLRR